MNGLLPVILALGAGLGGNALGGAIGAGLGGALGLAGGQYLSNKQQQPNFVNFATFPKIPVPFQQGYIYQKELEKQQKTSEQNFIKPTIPEVQLVPQKTSFKEKFLIRIVIKKSSSLFFLIPIIL